MASHNKCRGEHDAAEELYLAALGVNPFHKATLCDYGFFLERVRGDFDAAQVLFLPKHLSLKQHRSHDLPAWVERTHTH